MSRGTGDRGSVSIVAAALMCVTLVLVMGAADLARVLTVAARAQTAADAAAQELAAPSAGDPAPIEIAAAYAARNDAELTACACELDTNEATVAVRVVVGPLLFAPDDRVVSASARAVVETHA